MKRISFFILGLIFSQFANASDCAVNFNTTLAGFLEQAGTLRSVSCERNTTDADLRVVLTLDCAVDSLLSTSSLAAAVDRTQGESLCAAAVIFCDGSGINFDPVASSGKSAAEDFAAIRSACSDLL